MRLRKRQDNVSHLQPELVAAHLKIDKKLVTVVPKEKAVIVV